MLEHTKEAIAAGFVTVRKQGKVFTFAGVRGDMILENEVERAGAVWNERAEVYVLEAATAGNAAFAAAKEAHRKSNAAALAFAARRELARRQGLKLFDRKRAEQQLLATRAIKEIYRQAMAEHAAEINRLRKLAEEAQKDGNLKTHYIATAERKELASVLESLADGLAKAGESSQRLMNGRLKESSAIAHRVAGWQLDNMSGVEVARFIGHDYAALAVSGVTSYHGIYDLKAWQAVANRDAARATIRKAIARGLLTGEHPSKISERIMGIYTGEYPGQPSPYNRAARIAQTETNRVMNEAAQETYRAANEMGVLCANRWEATLDSRTRESHRDVDGEVRPVGEKFSNGCRKPGDGGASESINCRCALTPVIEGIEPDAPMRLDNEARKNIPYMTYREWEAAQSASGSV